MNNREITLEDDGSIQRVVIGTHESSISLKECQNLWRLLKGAFTVPVECVDYLIEIHGSTVGSLKTLEDMENVLTKVVQDGNLKKLAETLVDNGTVPNTC